VRHHQTHPEETAMANASAINPPTDLAARNTASVADALNAILADTFALYVKTKNFHWHMSGPHFRDYHLLLDEQSDQIFAITDEVAERVRKIGKPTLRSIGDIARRQRIKDNDKEFVPPGEMLAELRNDNLALVASLREAKAIVDEAKVNATSGILDDWTDQAERRAWFLFEATRTS
jgi:starvation-inducible DNA-binding protein